MDSSRFRLKLCLNSFFSDERARCYVTANQHKPVRWLRQRLRELFEPILSEDVPGNRHFALLHNGYLLPDDEPLGILHPDDIVVVVPVKFEIPGEKIDIEECTVSKSNEHISKKLLIDTKYTDYDMIINLSCSDNKIEKIAEHQSVDVICEHAGGNGKFGVNKSAETKSNSNEGGEDSVQLHELKERALHLLDQYSLVEDELIINQKRKRRRVRKRRRPRELSGEHGPESQAVNIDTSESEPSLEPVTRNTDLAPRSARVVHPVAS